MTPLEVITEPSPAPGPPLQTAVALRIILLFSFLGLPVHCAPTAAPSLTGTHTGDFTTPTRSANVTSEPARQPVNTLRTLYAPSQCETALECTFIRQPAAFPAFSCFLQLFRIS